MMDRRQAQRERKARYQRRQRDGRICIQVEIGELEIGRLITLGFLHEADAADAQQIGAAIAASLAEPFDE